MNAPVNIDRRRVLAGGGALIVSVSLWRSSKARPPQLPHRARPAA